MQVLYVIYYCALISGVVLTALFGIMWKVSDMAGAQIRVVQWTSSMLVASFIFLGVTVALGLVLGFVRDWRNSGNK